jgi:ABC-type Fe3+-siderophore transport system permease subunit
VKPTDQRRLIRTVAAAFVSAASAACIDLLVALLRNPHSRPPLEQVLPWLVASVGAFILTGNLCLALSNASGSSWRRIYAAVYAFVFVAFTVFIVWWAQFTLEPVHILPALLPRSALPLVPVLSAFFWARRFLRAPVTPIGNAVRTA